MTGIANIPFVRANWNLVISEPFSGFAECLPFSAGGRKVTLDVSTVSLAF